MISVSCAHVVSHFLLCWLLICILCYWMDFLDLKVVTEMVSAVINSPINLSLLFILFVYRQWRSSSESLVFWCDSVVRAAATNSLQSIAHSCVGGGARRYPWNCMKNDALSSMIFLSWPSFSSKLNCRHSHNLLKFIFIFWYQNLSCTISSVRTTISMSVHQTLPVFPHCPKPTG